MTEIQATQLETTKISSLTEATVINDTDYTLVVQGGATKKAKANLLKGNGAVETHTHANKSELDKIATGDKNKIDSAYTHSTSSHAPSTAQKNSDITKAEIEAKLTGDVTSHNHSGYAATGHRHDASEIDNLPSGGGSVSTTVVDNLTSTSTTSALSANQGRVIKSQMDNMETEVEFIKNKPNTSIDDTIESTDKVWSSSKTKEQISLIPKGDKGEQGLPGTASVAIDDAVTNTTQTWSSGKITTEISNAKILPDNSIVDTKLSIDIKNQLNTHFICELGSIRPDNGSNLVTNLYVRTMYEWIEKGKIISLRDTSNYKYVIYQYDSNKTYVSCTSELTYDYTVTTSTYYRIIVTAKQSKDLTNDIKTIQDMLIGNRYQDGSSIKDHTISTDKLNDNSITLDKLNDILKYDYNYNHISNMYLVNSNNTKPKFTKSIIVNQGDTIKITSRVFSKNILSIKYFVWNESNQSIISDSGITVNKNYVEYSVTGIANVSATDVRIVMSITFTNDLTTKLIISNLNVFVNGVANSFDNNFNGFQTANENNYNFTHELLDYLDLSQPSTLKRVKEIDNRVTMIENSIDVVGVKKMIAWGDSLTQAGNPLAEGGYVQALRDTGKYDIVNRGIGGDSVIGLWNQIHNEREDYPFDIVTLKNYDIITIMIGTNWQFAGLKFDDIKSNLNGDYLNYPKDHIYCLAKTIEYILSNKREDSIFAIACPPKWTNSSSGSEEAQLEYYIELNKMLKWYSIPVIDVYSNCGINRVNMDIYSYDTLHFNRKGSIRIAKVFDCVLSKIK